MLMRNSKLLNLIFFIAGLVIISRLLSFALMLPLGYSHTIMHESLQRDYDCIVVGSSEAMYAFDTATFDEIRGTEAYRVVGTLGNTDLIMEDSFWVGVYPGMSEAMIEYMAQSIIEAVR